MAVAGCSSASTGDSGTTTTSPSPAGSGSTHPASTTSGSSAPAINVPVTDPVRAQLLAAAAGLNHIPVAEFAGLAPGLTYYGLDKATNVYWAGARLVPAPTADPSNPSQAQVSSQDEGSYYVFQQPNGGQWTAYPAGNTGPGTRCLVTVPPAVLAVWGWPADSCRPHGI
jgi:hypothetical protein